MSLEPSPASTRDAVVKAHVDVPQETSKVDRQRITLMSAAMSVAPGAELKEMLATLEKLEKQYKVDMILDPDNEAILANLRDVLQRAGSDVTALPASGEMKLFKTSVDDAVRGKKKNVRIPKLTICLKQARDMCDAARSRQASRREANTMVARGIGGFAAENIIAPPESVPVSLEKYTLLKKSKEAGKLLIQMSEKREEDSVDPAGSKVMVHVMDVIELSGSGEKPIQVFADAVEEVLARDVFTEVHICNALWKPHLKRPFLSALRKQLHAATEDLRKGIKDYQQSECRNEAQASASTESLSRLYSRPLFNPALETYEGKGVGMPLTFVATLTLKDLGKSVTSDDIVGKDRDKIRDSLSQDLDRNPNLVFFSLAEADKLQVESNVHAFSVHLTVMRKSESRDNSVAEVERAAEVKAWMLDLKTQKQEMGAGIMDTLRADATYGWKDVDKVLVTRFGEMQNPILADIRRALTAGNVDATTEIQFQVPVQEETKVVIGGQQTVSAWKMNWVKESSEPAKLLAAAFAKAKDTLAKLERLLALFDAEGNDMIYNRPQNVREAARLLDEIHCQSICTNAGHKRFKDLELGKEQRLVRAEREAHKAAVTGNKIEKTPQEPWTLQHHVKEVVTGSNNAAQARHTHIPPEVNQDQLLLQKEVVNAVGLRTDELKEKYMKPLSAALERQEWVEELQSDALPSMIQGVLSTDILPTLEAEVGRKIPVRYKKYLQRDNGQHDPLVAEWRVKIEGWERVLKEWRKTAGIRAVQNSAQLKLELQNRLTQNSWYQENADFIQDKVVPLLGDDFRNRIHEITYYPESAVDMVRRQLDGRQPMNMDELRSSIHSKQPGN
eukprot:TRINITY_DN76153_c0_g1_i1.p1 TRINITY_DN76153_c0_g1~~TRINITY_DN76153_c0_g1_i1.p1  ORF type:complete len:843 (-),score=179.84 TRINITY_DN76153_c0_g1_i1:210-2738(-)